MSAANLTLTRSPSVQDIRIKVNARNKSIEGNRFLSLEKLCEKIKNIWFRLSHPFTNSSYINHSNNNLKNSHIAIFKEKEIDQNNRSENVYEEINHSLVKKNIQEEKSLPQDYQNLVKMFVGYCLVQSAMSQNFSLKNNMVQSKKIDEDLSLKQLNTAVIQANDRMPAKKNEIGVQVDNREIIPQGMTEEDIASSSIIDDVCKKSVGINKGIINRISSHRKILQEYILSQSTKAKNIEEDLGEEYKKIEVLDKQSKKNREAIVLINKNILETRKEIQKYIDEKKKLFPLSYKPAINNEVIERMYGDSENYNNLCFFIDDEARLLKVLEDELEKLVYEENLLCADRLFHSANYNVHHSALGETTKSITMAQEVLKNFDDASKHHGEISKDKDM